MVGKYPPGVAALIFSTPSPSSILVCGVPVAMIDLTFCCKVSFSDVLFRVEKMKFATRVVFFFCFFPVGLLHLTDNAMFICVHFFNLVLANTKMFMITVCGLRCYPRPCKRKPKELSAAVGIALFSRVTLVIRWPNSRILCREINTEEEGRDMGEV